MQLEVDELNYDMFYFKLMQLQVDVQLEVDDVEIHGHVL